MTIAAEVADLVRARYVFPETGRRAAEELATREATGRYDGLGEADLAGRLTEDLFGLCRDHHLRVRLRETGPAQEPPQDSEASWQALQRRTNFGIERVARLPGNVGAGLPEAQEAADVAGVGGTDTGG